MARGRPAKPVEIHRLQGTFRKDRHGNRREFTEAELPVIGEAPNHLTARQKAIWAELVSVSIPGVLRVSDRFMLEIAVCLLDQFRHDPDFKTGHLNQLTKALSSLGFSTVDRLKMKPTPPGKDPNNPFANLLDDNPFDEF